MGDALGAHKLLHHAIANSHRAVTFTDLIRRPILKADMKHVCKQRVEQALKICAVMHRSERKPGQLAEEARLARPRPGIHGKHGVVALVSLISGTAL